jgi:FAD/FMN-containing dehydrogenase
MSTTGLEVATLDGGRTGLGSGELDDVEARIEGRLMVPGDDGWDDAVRVWNGMVTKAPSLVAQPASARDVQALVRLARERRLLLSVKGGGHNIAGTCIAERGLMLDMSRLRTVHVDASARLAQVGPGCRLADVDRATQAHALATPLGFVSETGVGGLTLGGGLGYLTRRFGWTVDNLEEVEIVTADGELRTASRSVEPDLFWALRGGGGNFGVVTRFTFRLHQVGPEVYGGLVAWPFDRADEILPAYRALSAEAERALSVWLVAMRAPPAPFVPETWRGRRVLAMAVCYTGELARVDEVMAPVRALSDPILDLLGPRPFLELQSYLDRTEPAGMHYYWKTEWLAGLDDGLLAAFRDLFAECPIPGADLGVLHLGGALNDRAWDDGAVGNRDVRYALGVKGMWAPDEPDRERYRAWIRAAWGRVRPFSTGGSYINFQTDDEGEDRVRATYGRNFDRLVSVKRRYDPDNLFRMNRNVRPDP